MAAAGSLAGCFCSCSRHELSQPVDQLLSCCWRSALSVDECARVGFGWSTFGRTPCSGVRAGLVYLLHSSIVVAFYCCAVCVNEWGDFASPNNQCVCVPLLCNYSLSSSNASQVFGPDYPMWYCWCVERTKFKLLRVVKVF